MKKRKVVPGTNKHEGKEAARSNGRSKSVDARCIVEASKACKGEILFSSSPIAFLQGVDPEVGAVSDKKHEIYGKPFRGKILVFPNSVGSSVGAYVIYRMKKKRVAPLAMVNQTSDIITASGCAISGIPLFDLPSSDIKEFRGASLVRIEKGGRIHFGNRSPYSSSSD